jgi:hypothetical protein
MMITNRMTIERSDNSEKNMDNMHTQNAKRDMALEIRLRNPWGAALAHSVHPTSGRDCSGKSWLLAPWGLRH